MKLLGGDGHQGMPFDSWHGFLEEKVQSVAAFELSACNIIYEVYARNTWLLMKFRLPPTTPTTSEQRKGGEPDAMVHCPVTDT